MVWIRRYLAEDVAAWTARRVPRQHVARGWSRTPRAEARRWLYSALTTRVAHGPWRPARTGIVSPPAEVARLTGNYRGGTRAGIDEEITAGRIVHC